MVGILLAVFFLGGQNLWGLERVWPGNSWETKTPSTLGLNASKIDAVASAIGGHGAIFRYGYVAKTWGSGISYKTNWASASKPVMSMLLWRAIKNGKVGSVNDKVETHMADKTFNSKDSKITFYHLAHMISGWARAEDPGEAFSYNDEAINLYGAALFDYAYNSNAQSVFNAEFSALNFEHDPTVSSSKNGRLTSVSVGDVARIAWLSLHKGSWDGTEIIPASFFTDMIANTVPSNMPITTGSGSKSFDAGTMGGPNYQSEGNDGPGSYSYNFWTNKNKRLWPDVDENIYQGNGHWGRETFTIIPDQEILLVFRSDAKSHSKYNTYLKDILGAIESNPISGGTTKIGFSGRSNHFQKSRLAWIPNPFYSGSRYRILGRQKTTIKIFDTRGRVIKNFGPVAPGAVAWNISNVSAGTYVFQAAVLGKFQKDTFQIIK